MFWYKSGTKVFLAHPLEIILGANDFNGDTAERYGYVNRALPDTELDGCVDALARRIASFDHRAMRRRISSTRSHYHPPTGSSTPSIPFRPTDVA